MLKMVLDRLLHERSTAYRDWQQEQLELNYGKGIFGFVREAPRALQASKQGVWRRGVLVDPIDVAAHRRLEWKQWWCRDSSPHWSTLKQLDQLRHGVAGCVLPAITAQQVIDAVYAFQDST